jgi:hypothetical protein
MKPAFIITTHDSEVYRKNGHLFVTDCIESIRQNVTKYEYDIIVIDNASDKLYPKSEDIIYLHRDKQSGGLIRAWNFGVSLAISNKNDYFVIINDDVTFDKSINDFFTIVDSHILKNNSVYGPVCKQQYTWIEQNIKKTPNLIKDLSNSTCGLHGFFVSFNIEFYKKYNFDIFMFDDKTPFGGAEEVFHKRITKLGANTFVIADCEVYHHNNNHSEIGSWKRLLNRGNNL